MVRAGFVPYAREWWHFAFSGPHRPTLDLPYACAD
jgi:D-alanyl-D-alanine dipeptidase